MTKLLSEIQVQVIDCSTRLQTADGNEILDILALIVNWMGKMEIALGASDASEDTQTKPEEKR